MARGQKSFKHNNNSAAVSDDEIYMMVMLYTYQHKSLDYLARKFNVSSATAKEIIIRSRFGGACGKYEKATAGSFQLFHIQTARL